ncbi:MAG: hypothetical protein IJH34_08260 [Romboutsia sp.]|nr:hypothetical protein [Romboutsia sp.]
MNEESIRNQIFKIDREINNLTNKRAEYEEKLKCLTEQALLPVGTRVRLKYNLDIEVNHRLNHACREFMCYMNPTTPGTIVGREIDPDNVVLYRVRFDGVKNIGNYDSLKFVFSPDQLQTEEEYLQAQERLIKENEALYVEKNCLHKIIDRLLENSGYSEDIASAEDFEQVYEDMQIKRNELIDLKQENKKLKQTLIEIKEDMESDTTCESRECGCDDYAECLNCIKETILNKINEVLK